MAGSPDRDDNDDREKPVDLQVFFPWRLLVSLALGAVVYAVSLAVAQYRLSDLEARPGAFSKTCAASGLLAAVATFLALRARSARLVSRRRLLGRIAVIVIATIVIGAFMCGLHVDLGH